MNQLERHYAEALYGLFSDEPALCTAADCLLGSAPLMEALCSPCIAQTEKESVLDLVLPGAAPDLLHFFYLLCRMGRIGLLPGILRAYHCLALAAQGAAEAVMHTAFPPTAAQCEAIALALAQRHGKQRVDLVIQEDPTLLGGFLLTIGDDTYDRSVLGAMRAMQRAITHM